uniref:Uncharacterized protein n=1 Tax=Knipowitschia caucasica TaxID=637954 RepID=A0AAV2JL92_KNICA
MRFRGLGVWVGGVGGWVVIGLGIGRGWGWGGGGERCGGGWESWCLGGVEVWWLWMVGGLGGRWMRKNEGVEGYRGGVIYNGVLRCWGKEGRGGVGEGEKVGGILEVGLDNMESSLGVSS